MKKNVPWTAIFWTGAALASIPFIVLALLLTKAGQLAEFLAESWVAYVEKRMA